MTQRGTVMWYHLWFVWQDAKSLLAVMIVYLSIVAMGALIMQAVYGFSWREL